MMNETITPFFLSMEGRGQRLAIHYRPASHRATGSIVYVHPFGEEMNKARRMAALQSRALAAAGNSVLQIDLLGCGDSSGDFGDATWDDWVQDVVAAIAWLGQRESAPLTLWGLRSGCLIAAEAARLAAVPTNFLFWQPTSAGKVFLQQFLRLRLAASMSSGTGKDIMKTVHAEISAGMTVEVAGYRVAAALCTALERSRLSPPGQPGRVAWLEISPSGDVPLSPASTVAIEGWRNAGYHVSPEVVTGPAFWQSSQIDEAPKLIQATLSAVAASVQV